jgi:hypothetical protein
MIKNSTKRCVAIAALSLCLTPALAQKPAAGHHGFVISEDAFEAAIVRFYLKANRTGTAVVRECSTCVPQRLLVTPAMTVQVGGQPVEWTSSLNLSKLKVGVFYDIESKRINRIVAP